jgi:hypothetical protein
MQSTKGWAEAEFGDAKLGDERRTRRLVLLAAEVASRPAGVVTRACSSSASREAAFRFLENTAVRPADVAGAPLRATARRCAEHRKVIVATDATALTLSDEKRAKGLGGVGAWHKGARGVHVMSALAVAEDGTTLGICAQTMWIRAKRSVHGDCHDPCPELASETRYWLDALLETRAVLAAGAPQCQPWFQLDRGGDCWQVLALAHRLDMLLTVRATHDRRLEARDEHLWAALEQARVIATRRIEVKAKPPRLRKKRVGGRRRIHVTITREARRAKVEIRAARVPVVLKTPFGTTLTVEYNAVYVKEIGGPADDALEWMLLTTHPIGTRADVLDVVRSYELRWRIEDFHRVWKRGLCRVEDTQLRSRDAIFKWATLLATVATRAMRLTQIARATPDVPATSELTRTELEAIVALREPKNVGPGTIPTLGQAVRWIAEIGGYTGPWNGPPGPTVIGRGLHDALVAARAFENRDKKR